MCGVTGFLGDGMHENRREVLVRMRRCLRHRGPDEEGFSLDGEIYNFQTLRGRRERRGHRCRTECDTKVIAGAYAEDEPGRLDHWKALWALMMFYAWRERHRPDVEWAG